MSLYGQAKSRRHRPGHLVESSDAVAATVGAVGERYADLALARRNPVAPQVGEVLRLAVLFVVEGIGWGAAPCCVAHGHGFGGDAGRRAGGAGEFGGVLGDEAPEAGREPFA